MGLLERAQLQARLRIKQPTNILPKISSRREKPRREQSCSLHHPLSSPHPPASIAKEEQEEEEDEGDQVTAQIR